MLMKKPVYYFLAVAVCLLLAPNVFSKLTGSPGAKTGSPMDGNNCTACHYAPVNSGTGMLSVATNIPTQGYTAGQTYSITVQMTQASINRFGFEITCEGSGAKAGTFGITDAANTQLVNNNASVTHTQGGTFGSGSKTWTMNWTAPANVQTVNFYVSAMSANGNGNNAGDEVYTTVRTFDEAASSVTDIQNKITTFVNPISKDIMINCLAPVIAKNLKVYDISGRLLVDKNDLQLPTALDVDFLDAGIHIVIMNLKSGEFLSEKVIIP